MVPALQLEGGLNGVAHLPDVVCEVEGEGRVRRPPLSLVTVPPEHPPADFDVTAAMDEQTKKMKAFIHGQKESDAGDDEEDDAPRKSRRTQSHRRFGRRPPAVRGQGRGRAGQAPGARVR